MFNGLAFTLNEDVWCLPSQEGLIIGSGDRVTKLMRCNPKVFDVVRSIRAALAGGPAALERIAGAQKAAVPNGVLEDILGRLLECGVISIDPPASKPTGRQETALSVAVFTDETLKPFLERAFEGAGQDGLDWACTWFDCADSAEVSGQSLSEVTVAVGCASNTLARIKHFPGLNTACLQAGRPLLLTYCDGEKALVGPFVFPGESACYRCMEIREQANTPTPRHHQLVRSRIEEINVRSSPRPSRACMEDAASMLVNELSSFATRRRVPASYKAVVERRASTLSSVSRPLLRMPLCDACGNFVTRPRVAAWAV
ncbi:TOMM precursor leader peptide-binding protein [Eilatimonas milleporae]|uniref:Bacteriocin biosynthesis cyclodehydratase domain-containing protein n=1 Tax=Eilatimonas milleporae TaxID=911205 RepID=A0A3M0CU26_9PROT|nr:TOMM precursor leader peptide-binding protein [Eilatimonas milleporae]RMB11960.1 bacteriocin biosynthesis cyclodehydratase domain-containing protein [Eilatimonas milleporae]